MVKVPLVEQSEIPFSLDLFGVGADDALDGFGFALGSGIRVGVVGVYGASIALLS